MAYLRDSQQPPYEYTGSLIGMLQHFIDEHNAVVEERKQFILGNVTVTDSNDYINRSASEYTDTLSAIKSKLLDTHGGYLQVRYESDGNYLDWLSDFDVKSVQTVEYGRNLLDVTVKETHSDRITALIPQGAKITETQIDDDGNEIEVETDQRVSIASVNDGVNYVYDADAVDEIGWIWGTETWDDVTLPSNLLTKAKTRIAALANGVSSLELKIIDESVTGADIDDIHARQYVDCISVPHGIDDMFLCTGRTRDYLHASNNSITIGVERSITTITAKKDATQKIESVRQDLNDLISSTKKELENKIGKIEGIENSYFYIQYSNYADGHDMYTTPTDDTIYMGTCSTSEATAPTDYTLYMWVRVRGSDGETGATGAAGATGADGKTQYLHIKYSDDGENFTANSGEELGAWIGTLVDFNEADSDVFSDYTWKKFTEDVEIGSRNYIRNSRTMIFDTYKFIVDLAIVTQPSDYAGRVGMTATFTVVAEGEGLTYQWQYRNVDKSYWQNSSQTGNTTNTLSVPITEARDGQEYRVVITDEDGNTLTSDVATIHVVAIVITTQPVDFTGEVGTNAMFTVVAEGEGLSYQWQYQNSGGTTWGNSGMAGNDTDTLSVPITEARDGQKYRCVITDVDDNTLTSDVATLYVS